MIAKKVNWVGCQGSEPHFRGFPCSLWVLFHFLTVQATRHNVDRSQETGESGACAPPGLSLALSCLHWLPAAGPSLGDSDTTSMGPCGGPEGATQSCPCSGMVPHKLGPQALPGFLGALSLLRFQSL